VPRPDRLLLLAPALALVAACGSTVQVSGTTTGLDGTGLPVGAPTAEPGLVPGVAVPLPSAPGAGVSRPGASDPGTTPVGALPDPGTAFDRSPVSIGVLDVGDASAFVSAFGFSAGAGPTSQQMFQAMVAWYNRNGGIAGKKIKLVEYTSDPTATSYETEMSAACARFTQDNRVAAVLTNTGYQVSENYEACLTKAKVPHLNNSVGGLDDSAAVRHPLLFQSSAASVDSSLRALLTGLTANGFLTGKSKIGVLVEACSFNIAAYERTLAPLAKRLGLDVQRRDFDCVTGAGAMPQSIGQISASVLPFATAGVDRVLFVSSYQGAGAVFFEKQAASQGYEPWYGLTSFSGAGPSAAEIGEDAQKRIKGVGWSPDLDNGKRPPATGARKRCWDAMARQGLDLRTGTAYVIADEICGAFFALEEALRRTRGRADRASLARGLETTSDSPVVLGGRLSFDAATHHAGKLFAPFALSPTCGCFAYTGKPFRL